MAEAVAGPEEDFRRREQFSYTAPWVIYSLNWSVRPDRPFRLALGSFIEDFTNKVQVVQLSKERGEFEAVGEFDHPYPATKVMWHPERSPSASTPDLLGTSGDYMRLWEVRDGQVRQRCALNNNKSPDFCAPLTSFDWNERNTDILGTASIDTTCTIWSVETQKVRTQLIAHDKEVYDMAFAQGSDIFASVGADGSVRMFDLRSLEHSTIIYESPDLSPLLRLAWNKQDGNYLATFLMDSNKVIILDIRVPSVPTAELSGHQLCVNALAWAPHSSCHICTGGEDKQALIWDLAAMPRPIEYPILHYEADAEINQLQWSSLQTDWIAAAVGTKLQTLRV
eukprot:m51a1_g611 putative ddb1- and cul4-associated factor 7-like (338) ;mRNA; r:91701-93077